MSTLRAAGCVFAEDEAALLVAEADNQDQLTAMVARRVGGEPLEHIVGWAEFCGRRIAVDPGVFVPRRRTEFLVAQAVRLARDRSAGTGENTVGAPTVVVDLCCGSGAIGVALVAELDRVDLSAADIDHAAVRCAGRNIGGDGRVYEGDLFDPLPGTLRGRVDILAANVPYVPTAAVSLMPPEARLFEARGALDGGDDGLDVLRRVSRTAPGWLAPGGHLLIETSQEQAPTAVEAFTRTGLAALVVSSDEFGATVVIGTRSATADEPNVRHG